MDADRTFKLSEITKIFNVKRHFIIRLVETGIIKPFQDAKGRGKSRAYSYENLIEIGIFIHLNKLDLSHEMASLVLSLARRFGGSFAKDEKGVVYICITGFVRGEMKVQASLGFFDGGHEEPGEYLMHVQDAAIKSNQDIKENDFASYFILDVRNIRKYVNSRIHKV